MGNRPPPAIELRRCVAMRSASLLAPAGAALVLLAAAPALAADAEIGAVPLNRYTVSDITINAGERVLFTNRDPLAEHNLTSVTEDEGGTPLFATPTLATGRSAPAAGTEELPAGNFAFFCTIHPTDMRGTLHVDGLPDTRAPAVSAELTSTKLGPALRRGRLTATVMTDEPGGATLRARSKGVTVAKGAASLRSGSTAARLKLTNAGRRLLRRHARLVVTLTVRATDLAKNPATATARRTLRR